MFGKPSLMTRIAVGKLIGFLFGFAGFLLLPFFLPEAGWLIRWGILLWYTTVGAIMRAPKLSDGFCPVSEHII